ncbi:MAG: hypothetical protein IPM83_04310 [Ignavibacteria bacterium]|nr:hypothetical protein [Ignavibacteria bacterium]
MIICCQFKGAGLFEAAGESEIADAILDRHVHT